VEEGEEEGFGEGQKQSCAGSTTAAAAETAAGEDGDSFAVE
jgi:hypothetical protein